MLALAEAVRDGRIPDAVIALVAGNIETAAGLARAAELGIPTFFHSHRGCTREEHDRAMAAELHRHSVDLVCLAGYMRLLSPWFIREFENRILNIHPSLLPAFPGLNAQQQALDYGVRFTGCTVHLVDEELDHGPIVNQSVVPVLAGDTVETLSARILAEEHKTYIAAVSLLASGQFKIEGRRILQTQDIATAHQPAVSVCPT